MKSHIMTSMSASYSPVVLKYRGEIAETPLVKLKKEISMQYKALVKAGSALVANVNKHPYKKFKDTCRNCHKNGHKADEGRSSKTIVAPGHFGKTKNRIDKANVTCSNCQEKGHYANKCPKPKKDKAANDMTMCVGVTTTDKEVEVKMETELVNAGALMIVPDLFFDSWRWGDDLSDEEFEDDLDRLRSSLRSTNQKTTIR